MALLGTRSWRKDRKRARKEAKIGRREDAKKSKKNKIVVQEEKIIEDFIKCFICFAQGCFQNAIFKLSLRLASDLNRLSDWLRG